MDAVERKHQRNEKDIDVINEVDTFNVPPRREEASYLSGYIAQCMFDKAKYFLCRCYSKHK